MTAEATAKASPAVGARASASQGETGAAALQPGIAGEWPEKGACLGSSVLPPSPAFASVVLVSVSEPADVQTLVLWAEKNPVMFKVTAGTGGASQ